MSVVATYEGQQVHSNLIDALVDQEIKRQNAEREREHAAEMKTVEVQRDMMRRGYAGYWALKIWKARRKYGRNPKPTRFSRALWGAVGLIVLEVDGWYRWMSAWNRSA